MREVSAKDVEAICSETWRSYAQTFLSRRQALSARIASFGVPVSDAHPRRTRELIRACADAGCTVRNGDKSVVWGSLSPACVRCRTGVKSVSFFLSLACGRHCWFCFNENQCDWETYRNSFTDWRGDLRRRTEEFAGLDFVGLTGGEPLLYPDEACRFIAEAKRLNPQAHVRLYTTGDGLDEGLCARLAESGLDEIRFSYKLDDDAAEKALTLSRIKLACAHVPAVMVEMPVIPGTRDEMRRLLAHLEEYGAFGINLLELCFPLHHAQEFRRRGLSLLGDPYRVVYDYGYAGALPVAGSANEALGLLLDAARRKSALNVHFCSLENKNTAQIYELNRGGELAIPNYRFSNTDFFYRTIRCFDDDAHRAAVALDALGEPFSCDEDVSMVQFSPALLPAVARAAFGPGADAAKWFAAAGVIERDDAGQARFREVDLHVLDARDVQDAGEL